MRNQIINQIETFIKTLQSESNELTNKMNAENKKDSVKKLNSINTVIVKLYQLQSLYED
jgi:outer membrane murein-binding lipoprotein Lpp